MMHFVGKAVRPPQTRTHNKEDCFDGCNASCRAAVQAMPMPMDGAEEQAMHTSCNMYDGAIGPCYILNEKANLSAITK